jgi:hypothetical protein
MAFDLIIFDSFYRFFPAGSSENDNVDVTMMYNVVDGFALIFPRTAIVTIHHTSKGAQGEKSKTDVGSGAGAFSRAPDTHLILREHEEKDCYVIEASCRSWPSPEAFTLKKNFPLFSVVEHNPEKLRGKRKVYSPAPAELDIAAFMSYLTPEPQAMTKIIGKMMEQQNWKREPTRLLILDLMDETGISQLTISDGAKRIGGIMAQKSADRGRPWKFWLANQRPLQEGQL